MTDEIKGFGKPRPAQTSSRSEDEPSPSEGFPDPYKEEAAVIITSAPKGVDEARIEVERLQASLSKASAEAPAPRPRISTEAREQSPLPAERSLRTPAESNTAQLTASFGATAAEPAAPAQPIRKPEEATALANSLRERIVASPNEAMAASANATANLVRSLYS
jgi:hypothetical protein